MSTQHNITSSEAFDRHRAIYGVVRAYPLGLRRRWAAIWPSAVGFLLFLAIAACVAAAHA